MTSRHLNYAGRACLHNPQNKEICKKCKPSNIVFSSVQNFIELHCEGSHWAFHLIDKMVTERFSSKWQDLNLNFLKKKLSDISTIPCILFKVKNWLVFKTRKYYCRSVKIITVLKFEFSQLMVKIQQRTKQAWPGVMVHAGNLRIQEAKVAGLL